MKSEIYKRPLIECTRDNRIFIDSAIKNVDYVNSFGFEWTKIDGFVGKETMSHGHLFGRFLLPSDYFNGKNVFDIGCGNGRIGRLIAPLCSQYHGFDLSESVYAFPNYLTSTNATLVRASGTDLPLVESVSDVTVCWGVLHHMDDPKSGLDELIRITKTGGEILVFIYSKGYDARRNFNNFAKHLPDEKSHELLESVSGMLDGWREVDEFFGTSLSKNLFMSLKKSKEWQVFQWFDGITPQYHWSLEGELEKWLGEKKLPFSKLPNGCYRIKVENSE